MRTPILLLAAILLAPGFSRDVRAAHVFGTLVIDFRMEWDGSLVGADGTLFSPHMEYLDQANGTWIDIAMEPFTGYILAFSSPYQNTYTTPNFPLPHADNLPYGGVLAYYRNADATEGMVVGLAPTYTPAEGDTFDALFNPQDFIVGVSEIDAINSLKNPVPGTPQTAGAAFNVMVIVQPDIMPRWQYDPLADTYSLAMILYAFSAPQQVGNSESGGTFTPNSTPVPVPSGLTIAAQGILSLLGLVWFRRRATRGHLAA